MAVLAAQIANGARTYAENLRDDAIAERRGARERYGLGVETRDLRGAASLVAATSVFASGDGVEVGRSDTRDLLAEVVDLQVVGDGSVLLLVGDPVRERRRATATRESRVAASEVGALPDPAQRLVAAILDGVVGVADTPSLRSADVASYVSDGLAANVAEPDVCLRRQGRSLAAAAHTESRRVRRIGRGEIAEREVSRVDAEEVPAGLGHLIADGEPADAALVRDAVSELGGVAVSALAVSADGAEPLPALVGTTSPVALVEGAVAGARGVAPEVSQRLSSYLISGRNRVRGERRSLPAAALTEAGLARLSSPHTRERIAGGGREGVV